MLNSYHSLPWSLYPQVHMCVSPFISEFEFPRTHIKKKLATAGTAYNPCAGESGSSWSHWPATLAEWLGSGWMNICTHIHRCIQDLKWFLTPVFCVSPHLTEEAARQIQVMQCASFSNFFHSTRCHRQSSVPLNLLIVFFNCSVYNIVFILSLL